MFIYNNIEELEENELKCNSIINADCLDAMKYIADKTVDCIICDLPYGVTKNAKDIRIPFDKLWKEYNRIIKDNGAIVLFAQGLFYIDLVCSNKKMFRYDLIWNKELTTGFLNAKRMPLRQHEQIAIFYKKLPTYNPQFTQGKPLHGRGNSYLNKETINNNYGSFNITDDLRKGSTDKYPTSIISIKKPHPSITKHVTEKPIILLEYLIKTFSNENDVILDNAMGSGKTLLACKNTNRKFIGIDLDKKYFNITKEEIKNLMLYR